MPWFSKRITSSSWHIMTHDNIQYYDIINWCKVDAHPSILSVPYCQVPGTVDSLGGLLQPLNHPSLGNQQEGGGSWILQPLIFISIKLITHHFNFGHNWNCSTQVPKFETLCDHDHELNSIRLLRTRKGEFIQAGWESVPSSLIYHFSYFSTSFPRQLWAVAVS